MRYLFLLTTIIGLSFSSQAASVKDTIDGANFNKILFEKALFDKINAFRKANSKINYIFNTSLHKAAEDHAAYLKKTGLLTHEQDNLENKTVYDRVKKYVKSSNFAVGENVARIYVLKPALNYNDEGKASMSTASTYEQAVNNMFNAWKQSSFHKKNMLSDKYTITAIAVEFNSNDKSIVGVQVFARFG